MSISRLSLNQCSVSDSPAVTFSRWLDYQYMACKLMMVLGVALLSGCQPGKQVSGIWVQLSEDHDGNDVEPDQSKMMLVRKGFSCQRLVWAGHPTTRWCYQDNALLVGYPAGGWKYQWMTIPENSLWVDGVKHCGIDLTTMTTKTNTHDQPSSVCISISQARSDHTTLNDEAMLTTQPIDESEIANTKDQE